MKDVRTGNDAKGTPEEMNKPVLEAAKRLDVPVAVHFYDWHIPPFDNLSPPYLPVKEGFRDRVAELRKDNILAMPCINGSSVDMNRKDFERFKPYTVKDEAGGMGLHPYSDQPGRLLSMCVSQAPWQDEVERLTDNARKQYGVAGIFIDQVSGLFDELCFDPSHLHPLGGGSYWARGNRDLLQKVKNVALRDGDNGLVTSDGASEIIFDLTDANLLRSQPSGREIPLVQMIYSGYTLFFGSACDYAKSANYFRYAQGQALIDGRQNGWMDLGLFKHEYNEKAEYLKQCGKNRVNTLKYLVYGQLLDPVIPVKKMETFVDDGFGSGMAEAQRSTNVPCAEARLWKSEEGTLAIFFANYMDKKIPFSYQINPGDYGLPKGKWTIKEIGLNSTESIGEFNALLHRTEVLEPGMIKVVELVPSK